MPLDNITVKQAIWSGKPSGDKLTDEKGMFLLVNKSGKYWKLKYCSGQLNPDTWLGRSSAFAGGIPSLY
ncbi:hypothetical protein ACK36K_16360, partial [Aeromonas veronii]